MLCRVKIVAASIVLLVFLTCSASAKYKNYARVVQSPEYRNTLNLIAPDAMLTNHKKNLAVYADNEAWLKSTCRRDLLILEEATVRNETWALMMLDASSKLPSGLLQGNIIDLGQYDECLAVQSNSSDYDIRGHHCMYSITASKGNDTLPINPTLSICLPSTCTSDDIFWFFNTTISWMEKLKDLKIEIASAKCSPLDPVVWDDEFTICFAILAGFVTFLVACTVIEVYHRSLDAGHYRHPLVSTLAGFSLRKSAASILNMDIKDGTLPAIHGIRFLSMAWVVLGHEHVISLYGATVNLADFMKWVESWNSLYIFIAPFTVDTFFAMSGFLMTYLFLKKMPKRRSFNIAMYYLHRFFRLTPALIALLVFTIVFVPKLGSGARWESIKYFTESCRNKWWPPVLYVQNFVDKDSMCLGHLWYLAVDMQLFWISPLILYPLYRTPKYGLMLLTALFLCSLVVPASVIGVRRLPVVSFTHNLNTTVVREIFGDIYIQPYHRAGAWLVGIFFGYEVAIYNRRLNTWAIVAGWCTAIASFAFCTFGTRSFMDPEYKYNAVWEAFFSAFSRPIWAIGVCWIIYASINKCAGPLSSILSARIFLPLSRLSYCIYLVHMVLLMMNSFSLRTPTYFSTYYIWRSFLSTLFFSVMVAFLFSLLFESPIVVLEKMLLRRRKQEPQCDSQKELRDSEDQETKSDK